MKILLLDIETSPHIAYVYGARKVNINPDMMAKAGYMLCWSAKWLGQKKVYFGAVNKHGPKRMLTQLRKLMNESDAIMHYNGLRFDIPTINQEFMERDMAPPSPSKQIDLLKTMRSQFRYPINKLEFIVKRLRIGEKAKHEGIPLWVKCMAGNKTAWKAMEAYNKRDVILLEKLYNKVLPWIKNHPDRNLYNVHDEEGTPKCGQCGGTVQRRGFAYTAAGKYKQFCCMTCGVWHRSKRNLAPTREMVKVTFGS